MSTDLKKRRLRIIAVSALVGLLVFMGLVLAVRLLMPPLLADKIRAGLAALPEARLEFKHLSIEFLPRPVLRLDECAAILNQDIHISAAEVSMAPSMGALLAGRIEPEQVVVKYIVVHEPLPLAWPLPVKEDSVSGGSWRRIMAEIRKAAPHLVVIVEGGKVAFQGVSQAAQLKISDLEGTADLGDLRLAFKCRSNLWQRLQVHMDLEDDTPGGRFQGAVEGIRLANLSPWLPAPMGLRLVDGSGKLDLTAQFRNGAVDSVTMAMDWPRLTVERRGRTQRLEQLAAHGRLEHDGAQWRLAVGNFTSVRPALQLSDADILIDSEESAQPRVGADLTVRRASLDDLRALVLSLADDIPQAKKAADFVAGGVVQDVHLQTTAPITLAEMGRLENWHMAGRLDNLRLHGFDLSQPMDIQRGEMTYAQYRLTLRHADLQTGANQLHGIDLALGWQRSLEIEGTVASARIRAEDLRALLARIPALSGHLAQAHAQGDLQLQSFRIVLPAQGAWQASAQGLADRVKFISGDLPGPLAFAGGKFATTLGPTKTVVKVQNARLNLLDARLDLTGQARIAGAKLSHMDFAVSQSHLGVQAIARLWDALKWPDKARPRSAVGVNQGHLQWDGQDRFRVQAGLDYSDGPEVVLDIRRESSGIEIPRLTIQDKFSNASLSGRWQDRRYLLQFTGHLAARTLADMFPSAAQPADGDLKGRFQLSLDLDHLDAGRFEGTLQVHKWVLPEFDGHRVALKAIDISADGPEATVSNGRLVLDGDSMDVTGKIDAGPQSLQADLHLQADALHWRKLRSLFGRRGQIVEAPAGRAPAIGGKLRLSINRFFIPGYEVAPLKATLTMANGNLYLQAQEAQLCGLALAGTLETMPDGQLRIDLQPSAHERGLMAVLKCLTKEGTAIHGTFDLRARLNAQGAPADLVAALNGPVDFSATKGRIDKLPILSKVLAFLNVTEIFAGRLPDLETEGLPYDKFTITGTIAKGVLKIESAHLNGPSVEIASYGTANLVSNRLDLIVVVAPLKTIDRVIKKIPLVDTILGGNLLAVPVSVKGGWDDPRITPLAPGAVGDRLLKMFERTITLPGKLLLRPFTKEAPPKIENPANGQPGGKSSP